MARMDASAEQERAVLVHPDEEVPAKGNTFFSVSTQHVKRRIIDETSQCVVATVILVAATGVSVVCFYFFPMGLFVLVPVGIILSCHVRFWQIPTYLSFILLTFHLVMCLYHQTHLVVF